ncbi:MAG: hypothetical protein S4CHLAM45_04540 [Chlamydiales bacterium]|nr:hypothetical protein [Chlamydiales bacterium]MCH9619306.1 hypothetical protein [Chlamydiales bacterium]MCH9622568.1 hypothetical protein [Chlamydiales bacterium]
MNTISWYHITYPIIEYLFSFVAITIIIFYKISNDRKEKRFEYVEQELENIFRKVVTKQAPFSSIEWPKELLEFTPLLTALEKYNSKYQDEQWNSMKQELTTKYLLPWARKHTHSKRWEKRDFAARIYLLNPLIEDLPNLISLLEDKHFSIRMLAAETIGMIKDFKIIPILLNQMAKELPTARFIYRYALLNLPIEMIDWVIKTFEKTEEDETKICCLDIMSHKFYGNVHPFLKKHLQSENPTIRKMIATILHLIHTDEARDDLLIFLDDHEPTVRIEAAKALGELKDEKAFDKLVKMLEDDEYEVRINAAFALLAYEKKGLHVLQRQDADLAPRAHEVARFILTLP